MQFAAKLLATRIRNFSEGIEERLAATIPELPSPPNLARLGLTVDKWLLSSAVQKLMRRGQAEYAVKTALKLHALDPAYLPRRLPIIAFEDVGIGDLTTCFDTLHVFGKERFNAKTSEPVRRQELASLVHRLAGSVKSRTGCDIFCLAHADVNASKAAAKFARSSEQSLVAMACDQGAEITSRALALHVLSGMSVREGRWYRTLSRFNANGLRAVAEKLELPEVIAWLLVEGRNTSGRAAMLPLVLEVVKSARAIRVMQMDGDRLYAETPILGVPACAADMYTRVGKAVIAEFARVVRQKHPRFFEEIVDARTHAKILGMALFHTEGSKLDRWLHTKTVAEYRERIETIELKTLGWPESALRHRLYRLLQSESELLWTIRQSHLRATYGESVGSE